MNVFIVYWHPEPGSFNQAMFQTARETLASLGHGLQTSNLLVVRPSGGSEGLGGSGVCHGPGVWRW
jgi:hypothetical protein